MNGPNHRQAHSFCTTVYKYISYDKITETASKRAQAVMYQGGICSDMTSTEHGPNNANAAESKPTPTTRPRTTATHTRPTTAPSNAEQTYAPTREKKKCSSIKDTRRCAKKCTLSAVPTPKGNVCNRPCMKNKNHASEHKCGICFCADPWA